MKTCTKCKKYQSLNNFCKKRNGKSTICKTCQNIYTKKHYNQNKKRYKNRNKKYLDELVKFVNDLKRVPCADCNQMYETCVMEFDHCNPDEKEFAVSNLLYYRRAKEKLLTEITKCEIVCANCHRLRTHKLFHNTHS